MLNEYVSIKHHENYEMSCEGAVRRITDKKYSSIVSDRRGRKVTALPLDEGGFEVVYIQTLVKDHFGEDALDEYLKESHEEKLPEYISILSNYMKRTEAATIPSTANSSTELVSKKRFRKIKNLVTGQIFNSFADAAKYYNVPYDKLYDSIYNKGEFNGEQFERV